MEQALAHGASGFPDRHYDTAQCHGLPEPAFAEAFALLFLMPSLVTILSIFVLKEHVRWRRGLAVCAAFIGVLIIVRPGFKEFLPGHLAALATALCAAGGVITGRMIGRAEALPLIGTVFLARQFSRES